jgi:hypothetical protein
VVDESHIVTIRYNISSSMHVAEEKKETTMLGLKNISRFAAFSVCVLGASALLPSTASAQTIVTGTTNSARAQSSGASWTYSLLDDGGNNSKFTYYVTRSVFYQGDVRKRVYNMLAGTIRVEGFATQTGTLKYWAEVLPGGTTGNGVSKFVLYYDTNNNGRHDTGEVMALNASRGFSLTGALLTYASTFDLNGDDEVTGADADLFFVVQRTNPARVDYDGNGVVNGVDYAALKRSLR